MQGGHSISRYPQFHRLMDSPLVRLGKFLRYSLPLNVRTFKSSHRLPKHLLLLYSSVISNFAEHDTYPRTKKIINSLYKYQYLSRMLRKSLQFDNYMSVRTFFIKPPLSLYIFVRFSGYPPPFRAYVLFEWPQV